MAVKALDLFRAFAEEKLPAEGGYIISSFFQETSAYSKYEVVAYNSVKAIYPTSEGLTFQADGNKLFVLAEPANYMKNHPQTHRHQLCPDFLSQGRCPGLDRSFLPEDSERGSCRAQAGRS
jgi:hypothetical protein